MARHYVVVEVDREPTQRPFLKESKYVKYYAKIQNKYEILQGVYLPGGMIIPSLEDEGERGDCGDS